MLRSVRSFLNRLVAPSQTRRFEAAGGGRRWDRSTNFGPIATETTAAHGRLRDRARYAVANNPWAANGAAVLTTALVGAGIVPTSQHPNLDTRRELTATFRGFVDRADADGLTDFYGLLCAAVRAMVVDGEAFIQLLSRPDGLQLRGIPAEMVDSSLTRDIGDGRRIIAGIEFDALGNRVAYWISPSRPTEIFTNYAPPIRVDAADIIHLFQPLGAGQVRGVSWFASVLLTASELDQLFDALLVGTKVAAMHAGFLVDENGSATSSPFDGQQTGSVLETGLEPGTLKFLPAGYKIQFSTPQQAQQAIEFAQLTLRSIAAGLGIPEHLLTGDLRGANYSSLRAALVSFRQRIEAIQFHTIIPQLCRRVWSRVITDAVLSGGLIAPDFETSFTDYMAVEWIPPAQPWVDPLKDAEATERMMAAGLMSRRQAVAALGYSIEDLDVEIAADRAREKTLGLTFGAPPSPPKGNNNDATSAPIDA
jgi:lambda family phage portal protein